MGLMDEVEKETPAGVIFDGMGISTHTPTHAAVTVQTIADYCHGYTGNKVGPLAALHPGFKTGCL